MSRPAKLLDAYYADAVDVVMLRRDQARLRRDIADVEKRLRDVDATLDQMAGGPRYRAALR